MFTDECSKRLRITTGREENVNFRLGISILELKSLEQAQLKLIELTRPSKNRPEQEKKN